LIDEHSRYKDLTIWHHNQISLYCQIYFTHAKLDSVNTLQTKEEAVLASDSLLRRHVVESNKIEHIFAQSSDPLYEGHLDAARVAAEGKIVHPNQLHKMIACRVPELNGHEGKYRTCGMWVGDYSMPIWHYVPSLMMRWSSLVEQYQTATENLDECAYLLHVWLLCIHPYVDGNGRVARLVWNMLRINKGLSWHIEKARTKQLYYDRIRSIENGVFKKEHPDVY